MSIPIERGVISPAGSGHGGNRASDPTRNAAGPQPSGAYSGVHAGSIQPSGRPLSSDPAPDPAELSSMRESIHLMLSLVGDPEVSGLIATMSAGGAEPPASQREVFSAYAANSASDD